MPQPDYPLIDMPAIRRWFHQWRFELLLAFAALWVAYGFLAFGLSTAGDDWVALSDDAILIQYALQNGRWIHAALMALQDHSRAAPTFTICVLLLAMLAVACLFAQALRLRHTGTVALFTVLAGCFPFWAEFASFRILHLPGALALLLSAGYGYLCWQSVRRWHDGTSFLALAPLLALGALLFSLCAATYQGFLPVGMMLVATYVLAAVYADSPEACLPRGYVTKLLAVASVMFTVGAILYAAQVWLAQLVTGVGASPSPAYQLAGSLVSSAGELGATMARLGRYLWAFFGQPNHLFPLWPKLIFGGFLLVFLARIGTGSRLAKLQMLAALGVLVIAPWALGVIRNPDPYRYNAIVCAGLLYAVVICHTLNQLKNVRSRQVATCAALAIALGFVFLQNSAAVITHQSNVRDLAVVNRLLDRITLAEGYESLSRVAPVNVVLQGKFHLSQTKPFRANSVDSVLRSSIIDCDILQCQPARLDWAIRHATAADVGYRFVQFNAQSPSYQAALAPVFSRLGRWPASGAVQVLDNTTVLVRLAEAEASAAPDLPTTDIGMLPITASGDGFVRLAGGVGAFSVAVTNSGAPAELRLSASWPAGLAGVSIGLCQTRSDTGECLGDLTRSGDDLAVSLASQQQMSFAFFVASTATIPRDVLANRIVVRFTDSQNRVHGATSVALVAGE